MGDGFDAATPASGLNMNFTVGVNPPAVTIAEARYAWLENTILSPVWYPTVRYVLPEV